MTEREYNLYMRDGDNEFQVPGIYNDDDKMTMQKVFWRADVKARFELRSHSPVGSEQNPS